MGKGTSVSLILLLLAGISFSASMVQTNCSTITVTGVSGTFIDIQWQGPSGWGSVTGPRSLDSSGTYLYKIDFNGTYRLSVGTGINSMSPMSSTLTVTTCLPPMPCTAKSDCSAGQMCLNSFCAAGDCSSNADCSDSQTCQMSDYSCIPISCSCGQIANHACVHFECCSDANCTSGSTCVNNACIATPSAPSGGTGSTGGTGAANQTQPAGSTGSSPGTAAAQGNSSSSSQASSSSAQSASLLQSGVGMACIGGAALFILAVIVLFLAVALVAAFYKRK